MYPDLARVVLYPTAYRATRTEQRGALVSETAEVRLGESWERGVVVLAWSAVLSGARNPNDGHNVVFHELAHQLDQRFGDSDGAPYGATSPAEFFAVATETFFEKPAQMKARKPALYAELARYYRQDPAEYARS